MGLEINGKPVNTKKVIEAVFDFFITLTAVAIAGSIFINDEAGLTDNVPGLAITAAIGLLVWKVASAHKLVDK